MRQTIKRRISHDERGKISTGVLIEDKNKKYPKSLDYFKIDDFPELVEAYGEKPTQLFIIPPSHEIDDFYFTEYNAWASKNNKPIKRRECDGRECFHLIEEEFAGKKFGAGEISECICRDESIKFTKKEEERKCKSYTSFKFLVLNPKTGRIISSMCYLFQTHSDTSSDNIFTELDKIKHVTGGTLVVPFVFSVKMKEMNRPIDGKSVKRVFPIVNLRAFGTVEQILHFSKLPCLPTTEESAIKIDESHQIESPVSTKEALPEPTTEDQERDDLLNEPLPEEIREEVKAVITPEQYNNLLKAIKDKGIPNKGISEIIGKFGYKQGKDILQTDYDEILRQFINYKTAQQTII